MDIISPLCSWKHIVPDPLCYNQKQIVQYFMCAFLYTCICIQSAFIYNISLWMCIHYVRVIVKLVTNIVYVIFMNYHYIIFHLNQFFVFFPVNFLSIYLFYPATIIIYLIHVVNKIHFFCFVRIFYLWKKLFIYLYKSHFIFSILWINWLIRWCKLSFCFT